MPLTCSQKVESGTGAGEVHGKVDRRNALPSSTSLRGWVWHLPGKGGPRPDSLHVGEIAEISEVDVPEVSGATGWGCGSRGGGAKQASTRAAGGRLRGGVEVDIAGRVRSKPLSVGRRRGHRDSARRQEVVLLFRLLLLPSTIHIHITGSKGADGTAAGVWVGASSLSATFRSHLSPKPECRVRWSLEEDTE